MSNSSDGSDERDRHAALRRIRNPQPPPAPETRADRRYPVDPQRQPPPGAYTTEAWPEQDPDPRTGRYGDPDSDPRTGPAAFGFQPSPLQPRQPGRGHEDDYGRLPQSPRDLRDAGSDQDYETAAPAPPRLDIGADTSLKAPTRASRSSREMAHAPIVPPGSVTGRSLTLVVAIMCFLASLTTGAVYLMNQSASAWLRDIASEITVQVEAREKVDIERQVRDVVAFLGKQPGIVAAKPLSLEASAGLLEPWLGQSEGLKNLPVPRMIAVEVDRYNPPDFAALRTGLSSQFKGTALDDHRLWQQQIRTVTRSFALGGIAILMLVGAATMAIIVSATRSALASNREIVEVLHFVGATDKFIARQFQKHFLSLGIRAGIFGAGLAALAFLAMPLAMELLGGGSASLAELQHLVGTGTLDLPGYGWLVAVVIVIAGLCMMTSRIGVYRILNSQH
jgi:cell division transport system permease protein